MKSLVGLALALASLVATGAAVADAAVTPRAELGRRQEDPALLGWVDAVNGQFSDSRACDYPATLSSSGALAQCCASGAACVFWSSCSAGTLFAAATSLLCDQGYCNTAVLLPTVGAGTGAAQSYLGCWATTLGQAPFTLIRDIGPAAVVPPTTASASAAPSATSLRSALETRRTESASQPTAAATTSTAAAAAAAAASSIPDKVGGVLGLVALAVGLL
ncbi:hypothetical protein ACN47E_009730 [Coniothyrium glycines]